MTSFIEKAGPWLRRRAENVIALLFAVMFVAFLVQIVFRYVFNFPIGWTSELTIVTWIWLVLWGAAFVVTEREEIRFDLIYAAVGDRTRRIMAVITGLSLIGLYLVSLPAMVDYVTFMKIERTWILDIRFDYVFSCYVLFLVGVILFGLNRLVGLFGRRWRDHL